jgi:RNA polymerase sigma factor (sigma-70 family)
MGTPAGPDPDPATVIAAQRGDRSALDVLAAGYLPLVYNIVGRAMNGHPDVDDVVQETMLRAVRGLADLRDPAAFRSWLVAIAIRQVRDSYRDRLAQPPAVEFDAPVPDFADQTVRRLGLSGQRLQTAEATRWLDDDDRPVLALWWQEAAGTLTRAELAAGLGVTPAHAAVRVARMKERLVTSRMIVHALGRLPCCPSIAAITADWAGEPSPLWRKRLARHVRDCAWCLAGTSDMIPAERLLAGMPLLAVPAALAARALGAAGPLGPAGPPTRPGPLGDRAQASARGIRAARHARPARLLSKGAVTMQPKLVAVAVAVVTCAAGGTFAVAHAHRPHATAAISAPASSSSPAVPPVPLATHSARAAQPAKTAKPARPAESPAPTVSSARKGVSTWNFAGAGQALAESGATWYYNWGTTPSGIAAPEAVSYVPMIWGAANVTSATLAQVSTRGRVLLGFNEPDLASQSNMSVTQALDLWPQLMATGMTLGSPAVASGAATPGGWLDQFMTGARARGYRVDFIAVHWYGGDFSTGPAVLELESYLRAIYARYHLPIWLTEFALTSYSGGTTTFPAEAQQAAFLTAATQMLDGLSYVQRYAWFALPTSAGSGTTGLFNPGPAVTQVGRAFEAAR